MSIPSLIESYQQALNASDTDAILGLYGRDPVFMPQHAPALAGRAAVRAGYEQVFAAIRLAVSFRIHEAEEAGDWAWVRTSSAGRTRILAAGVEAAGSEVEEGNNEMFVLRREDGEWKIHRYLFATRLPRG